MPKVYAIIENGTEEVECLAVVDILRRAGVDVTVAAATEGDEIVSSHGVRIIPDATLGKIVPTDADVLFIPGGMPGTRRLAQNETLVAAVGSMLEAGKRVAAICAAPALVLGAHGFLKGKNAVCFPSFEEHMLGANVIKDGRVITDGLITTARGLGCAIELGLELVRLLVGKERADEIKKAVQF